ncbi:MAG: hypothetical protein LBG95_05065 [Treponema sp.]|jgi:hypothetical protein|nr:hypothetical protein [Treponema sp.]
MKKFVFLATFIIAMIVLPGFVSAQTSTDESARAEEARKKAADFESSAYFASEWEAAEAQYADAVAQKTQEAYNAAADAFDAVFTLTIPLYAQAREDEIMALRGNLISGGIRDYFPEEFTRADKIAVSARDQHIAKDYYTARDTAAEALTMYQTMGSIYNAWLVRYEIEQREFQPHDQDNFNSAGEVFNRAMAAYRQNDLAAARENADEALQRYNLVLSTAWAIYAELCFSKAKSERQTALDIKANIAMKELFSEADSSYKEAEVTYAAKDYEDAANLYIIAEALFISANESTTEKRNRAADLINQANEKIEESEEIAKQGEIAMKGGAE